MAHIYTDSYIGTQDKKGLERIAKDRFTDQATRDKAKALLAQKSGGSSSGSGTSSGSSGGSGTTTPTAPGHLIAQGSGASPGGSVVKTTGGSSGSAGSGTKTTGGGVAAGILDPSTLSDDQLRSWAAKNSQLWHSDPENRSRYEAENRAINALLDQRNGTKSTLDPTTGKWTTTGGGSSSLLTGPLPGGGDTSSLWKGGLTTPPGGGQVGSLTAEEILSLGQGPLSQAGVEKVLHGILGTGGGSTGVQQPQQQIQQPGQTIDYGDILGLLDQYISQAQASTPQYEPSEWEKLRDELAKAALAMNYEDWTGSEQYAALADRYGLQGQQSMQDMMGQIASRTGGLASSYAATASQQGYNDWMSKLEEVARQMFTGERSDAIQNAQLAGQYSDEDYDRYLNRLAQYNKDRSYGFDVLNQVLEDSRYREKWQNELDQQAYERQMEQDALAYQRGQDQYEDSWRWKEDARNRLDDLFRIGDITLEELYSQYPDLIAASGYNNLELTARINYYENLRKQEAEKAAAAKSGGGPGKTKDPDGTEPDEGGNIYASMYLSGIRAEGDAYEWLLRQGYNTTQAGKLAGYFMDWVASNEEAGGGGSATGTAGGQRFPDLMQGLLTGGPVAPGLGLGMGANGEVSDVDFLDGLVRGGVMTQEDRDRILEAPNGGAIPSAGYEGIVRKLEQLEDRATGAGVKAGQIIQIIETAQKNGTIREDEAKYLLRQYGLMD